MANDHLTGIAAISGSLWVGSPATAMEYVSIARNYVKAPRLPGQCREGACEVAEEVTERLKQILKKTLMNKQAEKTRQAILAKNMERALIV